MGKKNEFPFEAACIFGAVAFTLDVLLKCWELTFSIVLIGYNWNKYGNMVVRSGVVSAFFSSVYVTFSLILAYFLFKGIYSKLAGVIKLGAIFVLVLRLWECAGSLVSWDQDGGGNFSFFGVHGMRDEFGIYRVEKIGRFLVVNLAAAIFVALLFLYGKKLAEEISKKSKARGESNGNARNSTSTLSI